MPFRRRSCDACFSGRRKCDHAYPTCLRCKQNKKTCNYVSSPEKNTDESDSSHALDHQLASPTTSLGLDSWIFEDAAFEMDLDDGVLTTGLLESNVPNMVGELGELKPVSDNTRSWEWVIEKLKDYPRDFVQRTETPFIHSKTCLLENPGAEAIRAAFGICAACVCMNATNRPMLFDALNAEMAKLLQPATSSSLREDLAKMQAIALYQIIRLFHGDVKQQAIAEQQKAHISASMLHLLRRANVELSVVAQPTWDTWILAESARRTVMVAFMIYAVNSIFKHGICPELPTLSILPVSTKQEFWASEITYLLHSSEEKTVKYPEFTSLWLRSRPSILHSFEKMILVACKGIEPFEALDCLDS
jgi:Fungal Zn(2)-Cys(6) binuclear cluster domain